MSDEPRDVQLQGLLDLVVEIAMTRIRAFEIGRVSSYDPGTQTASVQPVVAQTKITESGQRQAVPSSKRHNVPVWFFSAGGARITAAPRAGDYGLLLYSSVSIERWKRRGGVVDPGDDRRHSESDAIFVPGMHTTNAPPTSTPSDALVLHPGTGKVKVGGDSGTQRALMENFLDALDAVLDVVKDGFNGLPSNIGVPAATALTTALNLFRSSIVRNAYLTDKTEVK